MLLSEQNKSAVCVSLGTAVNLAVIGSESFNFKHRVEPELLKHRDRIRAIGYDIKAPAAGAAAGIRRVHLGDKTELAPRLREQRPTHVLIESTDADHLEHIQIGLESGAKCMLCQGKRITLSLNYQLTEGFLRENQGSGLPRNACRRCSFCRDVA